VSSQHASASTTVRATWLVYMADNAVHGCCDNFQGRFDGCKAYVTHNSPVSVSFGGVTVSTLTSPLLACCVASLSLCLQQKPCWNRLMGGYLKSHMHWQKSSCHAAAVGSRVTSSAVHGP
jgi:hypothetical protein